MNKRHPIKIYFILLITILLACSNLAVSASTNVPLPADQAFMLSPTTVQDNRLVLNWQIAPRYYLYVKQIKIQFTPAIKHTIYLPQGELQYDAVRGRFEAYTGNVMTRILFLEKLPAVFSMRIQYQGCSHDGFCYPPMEKNFKIETATSNYPVSINNTSLPSTNTPSISINNLFHLLTDQHSIKNILSTEHIPTLLFVFLGLGLLLAFTPCVLPMIPILTAIIIGETDKANKPNFHRIFFLTFSYVLGTAIAYALAGLAVATLGATLQLWLQQPWVITAVSFLLILLSLSLFGLYELQMPAVLQNRLHKWSAQQKAGSYIGVFFMGVLSTLIISPCVTAPLAGVLMYIAQTGDKWLGVIALFTLGMGMGIPLLVAGVSAGQWLPKTGRWMVVVKQLFGLLMIAMAIWLFSRLTHHTVTLLLWMGFAILVIAYLILLINQYVSASRMKIIMGTAGLAAVCATLLFALDLTSSGTKQLGNAFTIVKNLDDFKQQLLLAKVKHQPVLLDFYADWCDACVVMDKQVFNTTEVKQALANYKLLRIDLTANTQTDELLLKYFAVIAPPTVLFFNNAGIEIADKRVVGELNANEFLHRLIQ